MDDEEWIICCAVPGKSFLSGSKFAAGLTNALTGDDEASHIQLSVPWVGWVINPSQCDPKQLITMA
jgi:hypothetical protein